MQLGKKMVQSGKKMVQSGKNETCDSRPGAPEVLLVNRGGVCAALDPVLLGYRGEKDAQPLTQCSWGTSEENARPSAWCSRGTGEEIPVLLRDQGGK